jgi:hypothetical protein
VARSMRCTACHTYNVCIMSPGGELSEKFYETDFRGTRFLATWIQ